MKNNIYITILLLSMLACSKIGTEATPSEKTKLSQFRQLLVEDSVGLYNYFIIHSEQRANAVDSSFKISALAGFSDSPTFNNTSVNSVMVNSRLLTKTADSAFKFAYSDTPSTLSEGLSLAGSNVKVKITGNNPADTLTKFVYMPKHVVQTVKGFPLGEVSSLDDLTLTWKTDALSPFQNVGIKVSYYSELSRADYPQLPEAVTPLTYVVPDNGSYTIPKSALQAFPDKGYIGVALGRISESEGILPITQRTVVYWCMSSAATPPVYLIESITVNGLNNKTSSYNVNFVNSSTTKNYTFLLSGNTGLHLLGKVPAGKYNVFFSPAGPAQFCTFSINGISKTGTTASIPNVIVDATSYVTIN